MFLPMLWMWLSVAVAPALVLWWWSCPLLLWSSPDRLVVAVAMGRHREAPEALAMAPGALCGCGSVCRLLGLLRIPAPAIWSPFVFQSLIC